MRNRKRLGLCIMVFLGTIFSGCQQENMGSQVEQWEVYEIEIKGPSSGSLFSEVELSAIFENGEEKVTIPGFYDGEGIYRIRFSPDTKGNWVYRTQSNLEELSHLEGGFKCVPSSENNHGPVRIVNTFYLEYADGSPFYPVGTTAYQWTSVKQSIQAKTLETLAEAPFNKIRMCVFPKSYQYGNETEPWTYPFVRVNDSNDFTQPNFEFFQNLDLRVRQLLDLGIQADVILFHPYDAWGYSQMGDEVNEKYVRYMMARLSAYRNVWWSLANEWDIPEIKDSIDWEAIGTLIQKEDPHQRLRGIHNWYDSEDHFYDHNQPWITHTSTQTAQFYNAIKWREQYQKPLLFDEMRYEGDVPSGWGNLKAEEMSSYFWMAGLSGGYGTHGETYINAADDSTEVRWWAKGGQLVGDSPERIRFFRSVMEEAPIKDMQPQIIEGNDPSKLNSNYYIFSKPGTYYLAYMVDSGKVLEINLEGEGMYKMEIIDTWNMEIKNQASVSAGISKIHSSQPYTAFRFTRE